MKIKIRFMLLVVRVMQGLILKFDIGSKDLLEEAWKLQDDLATELDRE